MIPGSSESIKSQEIQVDFWPKLDAALASGWGDWASAIGLIVTLIGFGLTLVGVWRSKSAAEKAKQAVIDVQRDIRKIDTVAELSAAISAMNEIKALQRKAAWEILPDRYSTLRKALITVRSANVAALAEDQQIRLQQTITLSSNMEQDLKPYIHGPNPKPKVVARWNATVSDHIDHLQEMLVRIKADR
ncbi:hypothetical protein [Candidatus Thiosymbion oneisti]|uniref:hypothetical protein n=1 Tax=Candidatus Thiosymbion oneisti TaxID=589554 RepID=UPI00105CA00A|nr:hypothetical protein [Candidatus Thiosymbion oneisti]